MPRYLSVPEHLRGAFTEIRVVGARWNPQRRASTPVAVDGAGPAAAARTRDSIEANLSRLERCGLLAA